MGIIHRGIPQEKVLDRFGDYNVLVETGTHVAKSAIWASDWFKQVYSVEAVSHYYQRSLMNVMQSGKNNIKLYHGNSIDVLPVVLKQLFEPAVFWLDAHWSRDLEGNKPSVVCPVLEEINIIKQSNFNHVILVDDARLFDNEPGWPSLDVVLYELGYNAFVEDDVIWSE